MTVAFRPGNSFTDVPAYLGLGHPDIGTPIDVSTAVFDPQGTYGGNGGLMDHTVGWVQQWNVKYEQELQPGWMLGFTYQGHDGRGLGANDFWNLPVHRDSSDSFNAENMASRRPLQDYRYQTRSYWTRRGDSRYHSGTVNLKVRTSNFLLMSWYALSHTRANIDNSTQSGTIGHPGPFDERDWGPPSFHRTHNFFMSPSYYLPVVPEWARGARQVARRLERYVHRLLAIRSSGRPAHPEQQLPVPGLYRKAESDGSAPEVRELEG